MIWRCRHSDPRVLAPTNPYYNPLGCLERAPLQAHIVYLYHSIWHLLARACLELHQASHQVTRYMQVSHVHIILKLMYLVVVNW